MGLLASKSWKQTKRQSADRGLTSAADAMREKPGGYQSQFDG